MTRMIADSEHMDHVTILLARVCAARLDQTITAEDFVLMVARLVDVAVDEATEDLVDSIDAVCPCCNELAEPSVAEHIRTCARARELFETSSTGAAAAKPNAEQPSGTAATGAAAAPSPSKSTLSAADRLTGAPSQEDAGPATGGAVSLAEPAPSQPPSPLSGAAADGAGGASRRIECRRGASQPMQRERIISEYRAALRANNGYLPTGWIVNTADALGVGLNTVYRAIRSETPPKLSPDQRTLVVAAYRAARATHDKLPQGWIMERAEEYGVPYKTIYNAITAAKADLDARDHRAARPDGRNGSTAPAPAVAPRARPHTHKADCWCRRLPSNQWCTAETLPAALRQPRPRSERYRRGASS